MSAKTIAILQARMSSSRLPGKVLKPIAGRPMLAFQVERVRRARLVDRLVIATSVETSDDPIAALCASEKVDCHRGSLADVLGRFHGAALAFGLVDHVVRLTGDCPLSDPDIIDACIALHIANGADYTSNGVTRSYPDGLDVEVLRFSALDRAHREAKEQFEREHVTPYLYRHPELFSLDVLRAPRDLAELRWTVDNPADLDFVTRVVAELAPRKPDFTWLDVLALVEARPEIAAINAPKA